MSTNSVHRNTRLHLGAIRVDGLDLGEPVIDFWINRFIGRRRVSPDDEAHTNVADPSRVHPLHGSGRQKKKGGTMHA